MSTKSLIQKIAYVLFTLVFITGQLGVLGTTATQANAPLTEHESNMAVSTNLRSDHRSRAADLYWAKEVVDPDPTAGGHPSLIIDGKNNLHVSYSYYHVAPNTFSLRYALFSGSTWEIEIPDKRESSFGKYNDLAINAVGYPYISYYDNQLDYLMFIYKSSRGWSAPVDLDRDITMYGNSSIGYSVSDQNIHISYVDATDQDLFYLRWNGSAWSTPERIDSNLYGSHTALALNSTQPIITYHAENDRLKHAVFDAGWHTDYLNDANEGGWSSSLAIDAQGYEHISFSLGLEGLYYYYEDRTGWQHVTVTRVSGETVPTALALDGKNQPHIAFVDGSTLYYATFDGRDWRIETVEDSTFVWHDSIDIALDSNDEPHIVYADGSGLKHASLAPTPDLVVTDIWEMDGKFYAQVHNVGVGRAPAGHELEITILEASPPVSVSATIPVSLAPDERTNVEVGQRPLCSGISESIFATADADEIVVESDESNNTRQEEWLCDNNPPIITSGPEIVRMNPDAVLIAWKTDEPSDSKVYYSNNGGDDFVEAYNATLTTNHAFTLSDLTPMTTYAYKVASADASGNSVTSGKKYFETPSIPVEKPEAAFMVRKIEGTDFGYEFVLEAEDQGRMTKKNSGIKSVTFYLNEMVIGQAFSGRSISETNTEFSVSWWPAKTNLTREMFFEEELIPWVVILYEHEPTATIVLPALEPEWEQRPVFVTLHNPAPNQKIHVDYTGIVPPGTMLSLVAEAYEFEWECQWFTENNYMVPNCASVFQQVGRVVFYLDGAPIRTIPNPTTPGTWEYAAMHDIGGLAAGMHTIEARALASDDLTNYVTSSAQFEVVAAAPMSAPLSMYRTVTRNGSHFDVKIIMSLAPTASGPVKITHIFDSTKEMMPVSMDKSTYSISVGNYTASSRTARAHIVTDPSIVSQVIPGDTITFSYKVVPIIYEDGLADPELGSSQTEVYYYYAETGDSIASFNTPWQSLQQVSEALKNSNYLIVTNPGRTISRFGNNGSTRNLFGSMARLATVRGGVLGFLDTYDTSILDNLLHSGHYWNEALHPAFKQNNNAYLLIVGEEHIIPAFTTTDYYVGPSLWWVDVNYHDQWYASTASPGGTPEINMGRIVGNTPELMSIPIWTSIAIAEGWPGYFFETPGTIPPGQAQSIVFYDKSEDRFWDSAKGIRNTLGSKNWYSTTASHPSGDNPEVWFKDKISQGWHLVVFRGHGNYNAWAAGKKIHYVTIYSTNINLNGFKPIVLALACTTGDYVDPVSIAEKFLEWGAGVYIGALEKSVGSENDISGISLWDYWDLASNDPIGKGYAQYERAKYVSYYVIHETEKHWVVEYQLYGDPKYGAPATTSAPAMAAENIARSIPETNLNIMIPDFEVTTDEAGFDQVIIPGGDTLTEVGFPLVPYWTEVIDYPAGMRVKDVVLTHRGDVVFETGLNLPIATGLEDCCNLIGSNQEIRSVEDDDWFLELDRVYQWNVIENSDGTSQLVIHIFPFHYQPQTTNYEWYNEFTFDIEVLETNARFDLLSLDKAAYGPGEILTADLWLINPDGAADLVIVPSVKNQASELAMAGIMLDTLEGAVGLGRYTLEWDSSGFEPGYYTLAVELRDPQGNLLHVIEKTFEILGAVGEITHLSAQPELFEPGDLVQIDMTVTNTGYLPLSGEVTIEVQSADGSTTLATYNHTVTALAPGHSLGFDDSWDSTGATEADYRITGRMTYAGRHANIAIVYLSTSVSEPGYNLFLPLIRR